MTQLEVLPDLSKVRDYVFVSALKHASGTDVIVFGTEKKAVDHVMSAVSFSLQLQGIAFPDVYVNQPNTDHPLHVRIDKLTWDVYRREVK